MSHNIIGSEATGADRLIAFCHVHGSIRMYRRRRRPAAALAFAAGALCALATLAFLALTHGA